MTYTNIWAERITHFDKQIHNTLKLPEVDMRLADTYYPKRYFFSIKKISNLLRKVNENGKQFHFC